MKQKYIVVLFLSIVLVLTLSSTESVFADSDEQYEEAYEEDHDESENYSDSEHKRDQDRECEKDDSEDDDQYEKGRT